MHHELEAKLTDIQEMKQSLVSLMKAELAKGCHEVDTHEAGEVVDMIKDLAETEEKCWKALYYKTVVKAMEESEEDGSWDEEGMGYPNRSARTGRYVRSGGHSGNRNGRMGYPWPEPEAHSRVRYDGPGGREDVWRDERYGDAFNKFRLAKRHYTETRSMEDKDEMKQHADRHLADTVSTLNEIWGDADPELRMRMKRDLMELVSKMQA